MATLNLGRIKPVFRGAYSGSTAYVVDDIVTSGGSSYICIQAHGAGTQAVNQTAYWTQMAAGGTDVGTTITTQGDLLYRDGSGLQRLAKGTASQVLKMNTAANAPEWGNLSSDYVKLASGSHSGATNLVIDNLDVASYSTFRIHIQNMISETSNTATLYLRFRYNNSGTQTTYSVAAHTYRMMGAHVKASAGNAGETSGTSEDNAIRLNWAMSKNTNQRWTQCIQIATGDLNNTTHQKDVYIQSFGTYYNNNEYSQYLNGMGICREYDKVFNGFDIYTSENWKGDYQIYGVK